MKISGKQIAAARELLGITQPELATAAGVSENTVLKFETNKSEPYPATLEKIVTELQRRGIEFTNGDGAGVRINYAKAAEFARLSGQAKSETDR
jgi:transcriptional regulator with XRE-family HTH domain